MQLSRSLTRMCSVVLVATLALAAPLGGAQAALISTDAVLAQARGAQQRAELQATLARADIRTALAAHGVDPAEAQARVATLSDAEVQRLSGQLDKLPAGGVGVLAAIAIVAIILVITDVLGFTDVYSFVVPQR